MASERGKGIEDLDLSKDEVERLGKALKNEEFRKMLVEYAEEISDPENRRKAEEEIRMMENERGMNVQFIHPKPGHVLKTTVDGKAKAFVNICMNEKIDKPSSKRQVGPDGKGGLMWHIPHSFAPPREDADKAKEKCKVFDVVFHPDTYRMAENNNRFQKLVEDTALEGIERQFSVTLDRKNIKRPKMTFKGQPVATVIRERKEDTDNVQNIDSDSILNKMPYPYDDKTSAEKTALREQKSKSKSQANGSCVKEDDHTSKFTVPKYTITHRSNLDMSEYRNSPDAKTSTRPNQLVIKIDVPLLKSAADLSLDIFEKKITLESTVPAAYKLDLNLPFPVNDDEGSAKFDKSKRTLTVTLPVIQEKVPEMPFSHKGDGDSSENHLDNGVSSPSSDLITVIENSSNTESVEDSSKLQERNNIENHKDESKEISEKTAKDKFPQHVKWLLPDYQVSQDTETVSFVIKVSNVMEKDVSMKFKEQSSLKIQFMSVGAGCFPSYYSLTVDFGEGNRISDKHSSIDISDDNLVVLILKEKDCREKWDAYSIGLDYDSLETKQFMTESNLKRELCALDEESEKEAGAANQDSNSYNLSVLEMQTDKLTIEIKPKEKAEESDGAIASPTSPSIQVVHRKPTPPLHSILKQRTVSESSEDHSSLATSSASILSLEEDNQPDDSAEDISSSNGKRRTVSFNKRVDQASFRANASVSSMTPTLKNRRRQHRKKEVKLQKAERKRLRKLSGGSGEGTSSGEETLSRESFSDSQCSVSEGEEEEREGKDMLFQRSVSDPGPEESDGIEFSDKSDDIVSQSKEGEEEAKHDLSGDSNNSEKLDFRTNECDEKNSVDREGEKQESVKWNEKVTKEIQSKLAAAGKDVGKGNDSDDDDDDDDDDEDNNNVNDSESVKVKVKKETDESEKSDKKNERSEVETMLSWEDRPQVNGNEHVTECAFKFSNTTMFDLDVD